MWELQDWARRQREHLIMAFVWHLPREIIAWATIRLWAHGTSGRYGDTEPDALRWGEAMRRWDGTSTEA